MTRQIYNIPTSCSFVDILAEKFGKLYQETPMDLADVLFLLPNRRSCQSLREAFIRFNGQKPSLLPKIIPINDIQEDEIFFGDTEILENIPPAINPYERLFIFTRLIASKPKEYGLPEMTYAQAFSLAEDLSALIDETCNENLSFDRLKDIVPDQYASHWQETLYFLQIITKHWPEILKEKNLIDSVHRKNLLLKAQAKLWQEKKPASKVVVAGTMAAYPDIKTFIKSVLDLPNGELYLYGLDRNLDEADWQLVDENHPQFETKTLLDFLEVDRKDIPDVTPAKNPAREELVSETMRPASTTVKWRNLKNKVLSSQAFENISFVQCRDLQEEALTIALLMRETLNEKEKTAALVTTDRNLARRTASELERWGIKIDDSAGKPLHLTPVGIFLRLIIQVLENDSQTDILTLAKHPLTHLGGDVSQLRQSIRNWEYQSRYPTFSENKKDIPEDLEQWKNQLLEKLSPLKKLFQEKRINFKTLLETHIAVAENICRQTSDEKTQNTENLWRGEDGVMASDFFSKILPFVEMLGDIEPSQYGHFLTALLSQQIVRPQYGTHPRLKILGPIEARFYHLDKVIIGGMNEGVWPKLPSSDPWMSRPMKKDFGLPMPERSIGVTASDLSQLLCAPDVCLTRSSRADGTPTNKSRWLLRLETVLEAYGQDSSQLNNTSCVALAELTDTPDKIQKIEPPAPCPPISSRPRELSVSAIETLIRDPYEIFASKILRLKKLNDLDQKPNPSDYGSLVHKVLERFNTLYPASLPDNAHEELLRLGKEEFDFSNISAEARAFWEPEFKKSIKWILNIEQNYRNDIKQIYTESSGFMEFEAPAGKFKITARADRIDLLKDGKLNIIDYKTGEVPSLKKIDSGYAPQLPLEAIIAEQGEFSKTEDGRQIKIPKGDVANLFYWRLGNKYIQYTKDIDTLLLKSFERLQKLIASFDFETTPYLARPNPKYGLKYPDFEHLARVKEWSAGEADDN